MGNLVWWRIDTETFLYGIVTYRIEDILDTSTTQELRIVE